ncbi:HERV-H LTR-associating protein 2 [Hyla sarda]|uniref:HERV-H LTR-associating protein 2 n=1 Tax=Hyla sarda TaxID=327740 RepID=UPI0024C23470|nr:HERV-H LTR-associating protein 2 [Hyla sarda]
MCVFENLFFAAPLTNALPSIREGVVVGEQTKDVILPCSFQPGEKEVIHWTNNDSKNVHSYYTSADQLKDQDKDYSGRTSLFLNEISKGNASLQIKNLKKSDENTYKCYVSTKEGGKKEDDVILQVKGVVVGEQTKDVILPCSFQPGEKEVIHWTNNDSKNVHSYYTSADQLKDQDKDYSGRTSLFPNEISKGNASLQIRNLKKSDENTYKCYVSTKEGGKKEDDVILQVIDLKHTMEYEWGDNGVQNLSCSVTASRSEDITIKWIVNSIIVHEDRSNKSSYTVQNHSLEHQCIVEHSLTLSSWTGTWTMKDLFMKKGNNITCGCSICLAANSDFYAKWNLGNKTGEVTIALMNKSVADVSAHYQNRIERSDEHTLTLPNLSANDNGIYICSVETEQKKNIEMTRVNIENKKESYWKGGIIVSSIAVVLLFFTAVYINTKVKESTSPNPSPLNSKQEEGEAETSC